MEYRLRRFDGEYRWILDAGAPRVGSDGAFEGYIGSCIDITDRKQMIETLEERLRFEALLSDLSARFINLPAEQVDKEVEGGLRRVVEFLDLDRSTLFQLSGDGKTLVVTHSWAKPGHEPIRQVIAQEELPWALKKVLGGETIVFSSVEELPEEAARDKLNKQWATYSSTDKANCVSSATAGYLPSYVELVTCLEMYLFLKQSRTGKTDLGLGTMPSNDSASAHPRRRNR